MKSFYIFILICILLPSLVAPLYGEEKPIKSLVLIYSRTGNTALMAEELTSRFQADQIEIKTEEYAGFWGQQQASMDAWNEKIECQIEPKKLNLKEYDLIFIGSPIWWYRPAIPLWAFVGQNDFMGKKVVLFNSFNSGFKEEHIWKFKLFLKKKGGDLLDHIYVRRGRWYNQKSEQEMMEEFIRLVEKQQALWLQSVVTAQSL